MSLLTQQSQFWATQHIYISMCLDFSLKDKEMNLLGFNLLLKITPSKKLKTTVRCTAI